MTLKVQLMTPEGPKVYSVYNDNREVVAGFQAGELRLGDEIIYRGQICELFCEFTDADQCKYMELLFKGGLGGNIQFQIL